MRRRLARTAGGGRRDRGRRPGRGAQFPRPADDPGALPGASSAAIRGRHRNGRRGRGRGRGRHAVRAGRPRGGGLRAHARGAGRREGDAGAASTGEAVVRAGVRHLHHVLHDHARAETARTAAVRRDAAGARRGRRRRHDGRRARQADGRHRHRRGEQRREARAHPQARRRPHDQLRRPKTCASG